ncbi:MAG: copper chaperone CopZ, partial [Glaciecola sp.]
MRQEYIITGMTCGNCQMSVEKNILSVVGVQEVIIDLST